MEKSISHSVLMDIYGDGIFEKLPWSLHKHSCSQKLRLNSSLWNFFAFSTCVMSLIISIKQSDHVFAY